MSRAVRRELFSTLETLEKANKVLKKILVKSNPEAVIDLLTDCQNCAIAIGNRIEEVYGNDLGVIHVLEDYCEGVYQIAENINIAERAEKSYAQVHRQLIKIREVMEQDIPDKLEVVFFPYKASMWDSLESVYLAAKEDPDCDAYCVPIPYYDKNPDGSFGAMHYEGNEYPKNIEVTDWQNYDFEIKMPDVIYIHNPYDSCNRVTSVYPKFYSGNLKKHTEKLIYIPYFVLQEIEPDDQVRIDQVKHFFFLPGIINADRVIVQSEKMKQIYINEYLKSAKESGLTGEHLDRKFLEKKFLGTGSPKIDKVLNTKKEDLEIPEGWLKVIEKPDGTWKKIIFYNTSVSALLQHSEKMLEKMKDVFRVFKEQQDEVALLWRPHPLIQATIESMRPQLWKAYQQIKDRYIEEAWGIYDDTPDMDKAVVLSDAYYGDASSVVQLCQKAGKPMMIQDAHVLKEDDEQTLLRSNVCILAQNYMVLISGVTNAVILISKHDWKIEAVYTLSNEMYIEELCISVASFDNKALMIPYNAVNFAIVDLLNGKQRKLKGCAIDDERSISAKFLTPIICGRHVWICGENIKRFQCIDFDTLTPFANVAFSDIHGIEDIADAIVWGAGYIVKANHIFLAGRNYGVILEINDLTNEAVVRVRTDIAGFSYFYEYDGQMLLIDQSGYEYRYDVQQNHIVKTDRKFNDACWTCIVKDDKRYYFEAWFGRILCIYEDKTKEINYGRRQDSTQPGVKFQFVIQDGRYIYFQERFSGRIFVLDTETDECVYIEIDVSAYSEDWKRKTIKQCIKSYGDCYRENAFVSVEELLRYGCF